MTGRASVGGWWHDYAEKIIPANAPKIQMQESKRAFYAGAASMLDAIMSGLSMGDEPTDADLQHMSNLQGELDRFVSDVKAGRA